jgi:hypothetical protein
MYYFVEILHMKAELNEISGFFKETTKNEFRGVVF